MCLGVVQCFSVALRRLAVVFVWRLQLENSSFAVVCCFLCNFSPKCVTHVQIPYMSAWDLEGFGWFMRFVEEENGRNFHISSSG